MNELKAYCKELDLNYEGDNRDIIFTSWIKDVDRAIAGLDIMALTSLNEGTPVSLIEAQAAARPVISTDVGGVRNVMSANGGIIVPSNDLEQLTTNLEKLVNNADLRFSMGEDGRAFVTEKFNVNRLASDMNSLYTSLLDKDV